jgi:hypothetical protein
MRLRSPSQPSPEHWSKDFVEHLRAVHFALLSVSVGLILLLTSSSYNAREASKELADLIDVERANTLNFAPLLNSEFSSGTLQSYGFIAIGTEGQMRNRSFAFRLPTPNLITCRDENYIGIDSVYPPKTFLDFEVFEQLVSSGLTKGIVISRLGIVGAVGDAQYSRSADGTIIGKLFIQRSTENIPKDAIELRLDCDEAHPRILGSESEFDNEVIGSDDKYDFRFYVSTSKSRVSINSFSDQSGRNIHQQLHELEIAAIGREREPLESLSTELDGEARKSSEGFDAFGFRLQGDQVSRWGMVALLSVQLYLVMYLMRLSRRLKPDDPGWDVPWMAMDESVLARILLFVTIVILPLVAAWCIVREPLNTLFVNGWSWHFIQLLRVLPTSNKSQLERFLGGLCACLVLSILSWKYRPKLTEPTAPAQLFE